MAADIVRLRFPIVAALCTQAERRADGLRLQAGSGVDRRPGRDGGHEVEGCPPQERAGRFKMRKTVRMSRCYSKVAFLQSFFQETPNHSGYNQEQSVAKRIWIVFR